MMTIDCSPIGSPRVTRGRHVRVRVDRSCDDARDPLYTVKRMTDRAGRDYPSELRNEALRVYRRYMLEVVEGFTLCPWAAAARRDGHVTEQVILAENQADPQQSLTLLKSLAAETQTEIALFIYPDLELDRLGFEAFLRMLRELYAGCYEVGTIPFAMAAFHPDARPDLQGPERLIPFLRRTPDPTIQVVRRTALERVRGSSQEGTSFFDLSQLATLPLPQNEPVSLRQRIAQANLDTALDVGIDTLEALFLDIRRDRDESYARIGHRGST
jgi:hypothetical protein